MSAAQITDLEAIRTFALAGSATFTVVSKKTGARFTFKVETPKNNDKIHFVKVLNGPDNYWNYQYLGILKNGTFRHGKKSKVGKDAPSVRAFAWFCDRLHNGNPLGLMEFWHSGACGRCGRKLTVPESISTGLGPVCSEAM